MLSNLKIENIAVIESASIDFTGSLNCFTGETGAGKSIIIDAANAVLGEKTSRDLIRTGVDSAKVTAVFCDISPDVKLVLRQYDIQPESDGTLIIQRSLLRDGKNICRVNGELVTVSMLKAIGLSLVNIHGQSDSQDLLAREKHYRFIDNIAQNAALLEDYQDLYNKMKAVKAEIDAMVTDDQAKEQRVDMLAYQINELETADITTGETEELLSRQRLAASVGRVMDLLRGAYEALYGADDSDGAGDLAARAADLLEEAGQYVDGAGEIYNTVYEAAINLNDCAHEVNSLFSQIDVDAIDIDSIEERLDLLYRLRRKYGSSEEEMLEYLENARQELENIQYSDEKLAILNTELASLRQKALDAAKELSLSRKKAADGFSREIAAQLKFLDMPDIIFSVKIDETKMSPTGIDDIEFLISPNVGETPKPLSKIASGGELSRIMLAIKTVLAARDEIGTLIFDEIDAGVSGRAAGKIGLKLKEVSQYRQVICVTHLSQIAALADSHLYIEKEVSGQKTYTRVTQLDFEGRKRELARIIGGINITELQLKNAEEMLLNANKQEFVE